MELLKRLMAEDAEDSCSDSGSEGGESEDGSVEETEARLDDVSLCEDTLSAAPPPRSAGISDNHRLKTRDGDNKEMDSKEEKQSHGPPVNREKNSPVSSEAADSEEDVELLLPEQ